MRLTFAVLSLLAVAVIALRSDQTRRDRRLREVDPQEVQQFRSGKEYRYQLDTQISSGFATVSDQHAMTRLQAQALLQFQSERAVTLRLDDISMGSLNRDVSEPEKVYPMEMFKDSQMEDKERRLLRLPVQFDYVDGIIENLRFHQEDKPWSKNIKRSVLNMIQVNLKERKGLVELEPYEKERKEDERLPEVRNERFRAFTLPEMTLEGECQVTYTMNKMSPKNRYNTYSREDRDEEFKMFNSTKSIDFKNCRKIADVRFGPKVEKPCQKCDVEELEERKLDRSTTIRHVFVGNQENFGIMKVEMVSHYMFKMINAEEERPMRTIVTGELNYIDFKELRNTRDEESTRMSQKEELLYNLEWDMDEKRFYMYGDEEFPNNSPFKKINNKVNQIERLISKLARMWSDKVNGIESEATTIFTKIVELTRMCTIDELKELRSKFGRGSDRMSDSEQQKSEEIFVDALTQSGTQNTIKFLVDKIMNKEIQTVRAVRAITHLKGVPAPSEKQVETLINLCQSETARRTEPLRQTCWLTTGAIMGELCDEQLTRDDGFERQLPKPICQREQKQKFVKVFMELFKKAETRYDKILALKALGNAGLDEQAIELEKIVRDIREDPLVRMQAIDSFRRLRAIMPKKIQRVLMPVFQNSRERPEIRMAAISMILPTIPEKHMLDQIAFTLLKEPSRQVRSFVYTVMNSLSESPIEPEKKLAEHLKALVKMVDITEEEERELVRGSRFYRVPIYSHKNREGIYAEFESMVGPDNYLPKRVVASIDTLFSGILEKNGLELRFTQEDLEDWYHKIYDSMVDSFYFGQRKESNLRAKRSRRDESSSEETQEGLNSLYSKLNIKKRSRDQFWRVDSDSNNEIDPYGMFCLRYADIDYVILPLEEEVMPEALKRILISGEKPSLRDFERMVEFFQGRHFRFQAAFNVLDWSMKIPTSMGLPIKLWHVLPILGSVDGQIKARMDGSELTLDTNIHPVLTATHIKRVEIWCPVLLTGAETSQTIELNLPLNSEVRIQKNGATWKVRIPETRTQIFGLHTLPHTFVAENDRQTYLPKMPMVKRIENIRLQHQLRMVETVLGEHSLGLPFKINGEIHMPRDLTDYKRVINTLLTSENHIHATFEPHQDSPREILFQLDADTFKPNTEGMTYHRQLKGFYGKAKFDDEYERQYDSDEFDTDEEDESRLSSYLDSYEPRKMYKHGARLSMKTVGGRKEKFVQMEMEVSCDDRLKYCNGQLNIRRSPFFEESTEWKMNLKAQTLYPEYVSDVEELTRQDKKQKKFVAHIEAKWGSEHDQEALIHINGETFKPKVWLKRMNEIERYERSDNKLEEQMRLKTAFLNKFDISVEYKGVQPWTQNKVHEFFNVLKVWEFMSTKAQLQRGRDGAIYATLVIDPITHQHVNMSIKTPSEKVIIDSIRLPMKVKPFELVRYDEVSSRANNFMDVVRSYSSKTRPECKFDGKRVETFDDVEYKAPLTKCYTVLAKDCSSETPRFVVMMKKMDRGDKKLKMTTSRSQVVEVHRNNGKLVVKVNGDRIDDPQELSEMGIEYSEDMVHIETRDVSVRFNGDKCWIKLAQTHKNTQCGLCGHYNDDSDDEFRMANNEHTYDLKKFHKTYSVMDDECRADLEETHRRESYERIDSDEYDDFVRRGDDRRNDEETKKPFEKTHVIEYNQKICFSEKPIKECPRGTYATEEKEQKVKYLCYKRTSSEGRRLLREAQRSTILELPKQNPSFTENVQIPVKCEVY